jgi:hypothetical protein
VSVVSSHRIAPIVGATLVTLFALGAGSASGEGSRKARVTFTTPCVDPIKDAKARLLVRHSHSDQELLALNFYILSSEYAVDLDGDGRRDVFVAETGSSGSGGNAWDVYVRRGDCAHHVGGTTGRDLRRLKKRHKGLFDFRIETRGGFDFRHHYDWRFDGKEYQLVRVRECNWHWGQDRLLCKPWEK